MLLLAQVRKSLTLIKPNHDGNGSVRTVAVVVPITRNRGESNIMFLFF
jgi:hypothetical protein